MERNRLKRALVTLLSLAMVITYMPVSSFVAYAAGGTTAWTEVAFSDITESDTIAITLTNGTDTWAMPNAPATSGNPAAVTAPLDENGKLTGLSAADYGFTFKEAAGGVNIKSGSNYLNVNNNSNGSRINGTAGVWTLDGDYLKSADNEGNERWLCVYKGANGTDWRGYKASGKVKGQKISFWKAEAELPRVAKPAADTASGDIEVGTRVSLSCATDGATISYKVGAGDYQSYTEPIEVTDDMELTVKASKSDMADSEEVKYSYKAYRMVDKLTLAETISDGDKVVIYNPSGGKAMAGEDYIYTNTSGTSKHELTSVDASVAGGELTAEGAQLFTVTVDGNASPATYSFAAGEKWLFTDGTDVMLADEAGDNTLFQLEQQDGGYYIRANSAEVSGKPQYLEFYNGYFTAYKLSTTGTAPFLMQLYKQSEEKVYLHEAAPETVATPTAEPAAGAVRAGAEISFSCATDGAVILYKKAGDADFTAYSDPIAITEDTTFTVKATKQGMLDSDEATFEYTIKDDTPLVADGDYLIYNPANKLVMSSEKENNYNVPVSMDIADVTAEQSAEQAVIWHVTNNADGSVTISYGGQKLAMGASYSSMTLGEVNDKWEIKETGTDGLYGVRNVGRNLMLQYRGGSYNYFSCYGQACTAPEFQFNFVPAKLSKVATPTAKPAPGEVESGTEISFACATEGAAIMYKTADGADFTAYKDPISITEDTTFTVKATKSGIPDSDEATFEYTIKTAPAVLLEKLTEAPADGASVVIYNGGNSFALGTTLTGTAPKTKLEGVAAEADSDGKLTLSDEMALLTVGVDGDDYTFAVDGRYLTSADAGNGISFSDTLTDMGRWNLEQQTDGSWVIRNKGASYNGNHNQALEYFSGFTTYGQSGDATAAFKMDIYGLADTHLVPDGDYLIYNPANKLVMSSEKDGNYNAPVSMDIADVTARQEADPALIWHVTNNDEDGTVTISYDGQKLAMGASYSSMTLGEIHDKWEIKETGTDGLYGVRNVGRNAMLEYYADKGYFSCHGQAFTSPLFRFNFVPAKAKQVTPAGELNDGDEVVIYNENDASVIGMPKDGSDSTSLKMAAATIENDKAVVANGGRVFTVGVADGRYTFKSGGQYLATNNAENLIMTDSLSDDGATACTYWTLTEKNGGYIIYSSTAKYNGSTPVCIEFFGGFVSGWTFKSSTPDLFVMKFYPVADDTLVVDGIVDKPTVSFDTDRAFKDTEYSFSYTLDSIFDIDGELALTVNGEAITATKADDGSYKATVPAGKVTGPSLEISVSGKDVKGAEIKASRTVNVIDEPFISNLKPERNAETGDDKRPEISADVTNFGTAPTVAMTVNGKAVDAAEVSFDEATGKVTYTPAADLSDGKTTVEITVTRSDNAEGSAKWSFWVGKASYSMYFGQLHSHTAEYSDGAGTLKSALEHVESLPASAKVDFVAFTDHSNYFDSSSAANPEAALYDVSQMTADSKAKWDAYNKATDDFNAAQQDKVALSGFEMTWSGGPGHINTFATPGVVSRNNTTLNNKTSDAGMKAYYQLLDNAELKDSISQFNHPGKTFGTFADFGYYDAVTDTRMYLVEVGNGEGQIGSGGYFPSYEYYTMALDKGWHVAPTNNQDNHKGSWGNANDARDVIITEDFTEEGIYDAIRHYRVYSTEDKNLEVTYTVNGELMGSTISEVPDELKLSVNVYDPDSTDSISKVEVVANSGKTVYTWDDADKLAKGDLEATLAPDYTYYFIRVTEKDGDLAVTAPVWVGESLQLGISSFECGTSMPVTDEELTLTTTLFNNMASAANVTSLTYAVDGEDVYTDTAGHEMAASGTLPVEYKYTPTKAKLTKVKVTAEVEQDGKKYNFSKDIELDVSKSEELVYFGIDASHYNEYVSGNYKDSMGNFAELAAGYGVRVVTLNTSQDLINACSNEKFAGLILTTPSRRLPEAQKALLTYSDDEVSAIKAFNEGGGIVVVTGWSDYYENYSEVAGMSADQHMAAAQNKVLEALGTELRINDDATVDAENNGGQEQRLYFTTYNMDNPLLEGVIMNPDKPDDRTESEVYSQYGGCSIGTTDGTVPDTVTTAVFGHKTTTSKDSDSDGLGGNAVGKFDCGNGDERLLVTATDDQDGKGLIVVSGAAFMSNFEVQAELDNNAQKNYANYKVCENLVKKLNPVRITPIEDVRKVTEEGYKFTIQGTVTSNASGYQKETAFFDCIYVQDETGGLCCFPVDGSYKVGDVVRIVGTTDLFQGEPELQVKSVTKVDEAAAPEPVSISAAELNDRSREGMLVKVSGTITKVEKSEGRVQSIYYKDDAGDTGRIFIDGYIYSATSGTADVENAEVGNTVTAVGLASYDDTFNAPDGPFPRIRVRDRADVVCTHVHKLSKVDEVKATYSAGGIKAHYKCSVCGKLFLDKGGKQETTLAKLKTPKLVLKAPYLRQCKANSAEKTMTMKWDKVKGATYYRAYYRQYGKAWKSAKTTGTSYVVKGHKADALYQYKVIAYVKEGSKTIKSPESRSIYRFFRRVTHVKAAAVKGGAKITWKASSKNSSYQVSYRIKGQSKYTKVNVAGGSSASSYTLKGVKKGQTIYIKVRPVKKASGHQFAGAFSGIRTVTAK